MAAKFCSINYNRRTECQEKYDETIQWNLRFKYLYKVELRVNSDPRAWFHTGGETVGIARVNSLANDFATKIENQLEIRSMGKTVAVTSSRHGVVIGDLR